MKKDPGLNNINKTKKLIVFRTKDPDLVLVFCITEIMLLTT